MSFCKPEELPKLLPFQSSCRGNVHKPGLRIPPKLPVGDDRKSFFFFGVVPTLLAATAVWYYYRNYQHECKPRGGKQPRKNTLKLIENAPTTFDNCGRKIELSVLEIHTLNENTKKFIFELPSKEHRLGIPIGKEVLITATFEGEEIKKAFSPINLEDELGRLEIISKVEDPADKNSQDKMSQLFFNMKPCDIVTAYAPHGRFEYLGKGQFSLLSENSDYLYAKRTKELGLIAVGDGISKLLRLIRYCKNEGSRSPRISLLYSTTTPYDTIEEPFLETLAKTSPQTFKMQLAVNEDTTEEKDWSGVVGSIDAEMISEHLPQPSVDSYIIVSGSEEIVELLLEAEYTPNRILSI